MRRILPLSLLIGIIVVIYIQIALSPFLYNGTSCQFIIIFGDFPVDFFVERLMSVDYLVSEFRETAIIVLPYLFLQFSVYAGIQFFINIIIFAVGIQELERILYMLICYMSFYFVYIVGHFPNLEEQYNA